MSIKNLQLFSVFTVLLLLLLLLLIASFAGLRCGRKEINPYDPFSDTSPPEEFNVSFDNGWVFWNAGDQVRGVVKFGTDPDSYDSYGFHRYRRFASCDSILLLDLDAGQTYYYRLRLYDRAGNDTLSSEGTFYLPDVDERPLLRCTMIDVGWGDAHFLETPGGIRVLIDSGLDRHADDVSGFLRSKNIGDRDPAIDYIVLTHLHTDHTDNFITRILTQYTVGYFYDSVPHVTKYTDPSSGFHYEYYKELLHAIEKNGIQYITPETGDFLYWDPAITCQVINAGNPFNDSNENNSSLVVKVSYGEIDLLLTGDAEVPLEGRMIETFSNLLESEVLKVGHHGNNDASSGTFLDYVHPKIALIPVDSEEVEGSMPEESVLSALANRDVVTYRSDKADPFSSDIMHGHVEVLTDGISAITVRVYPSE